MAITARNRLLTEGPLSRFWFRAAGRRVLKPKKWLGIRSEPSSKVRSIKLEPWKVKSCAPHRLIVITSEKDRWIRKGRHRIGMSNLGVCRHKCVSSPNLHNQLKISLIQNNGWISLKNKCPVRPLIYDYCILHLFRFEPCFHSWFNCYLEYQKGRRRRRESPCREVWYFRRPVGSDFFRHCNLLDFDLSKQLSYTLTFPKCEGSKRHQR